MLFFNFDDDKGILKYKKDKNIIEKSSNDFYKSLNNIKDVSKKIDTSYESMILNLDLKKSKSKKKVY